MFLEGKVYGQCENPVYVKVLPLIQVTCEIPPSDLLGFIPRTRSEAMKQRISSTRGRKSAAATQHILLVTYKLFEVGSRKVNCMAWKHIVFPNVIVHGASNCPILYDGYLTNAYNSCF